MVYFSEPQFYMTANQGVVGYCCTRYCGLLVPVLVGGTYRNGGKNVMQFNLATSQGEQCGIPVINVIQGNLEGLVGRDDLAELNLNADSIRLKIEVGSPSVSSSLD